MVIISSRWKKSPAKVRLRRARWKLSLILRHWIFPGGFLEKTSRLHLRVYTWFFSITDPCSDPGDSHELSPPSSRSNAYIGGTVACHQWQLFVASIVFCSQCICARARQPERLDPGFFSRLCRSQCGDGSSYWESECGRSGSCRLGDAPLQVCLLFKFASSVQEKITFAQAVVEWSPARPSRSGRSSYTAIHCQQAR